MAQEKQNPVLLLLSRALHRIRTTPPRIIASPATQPRRAAVAIVIRVVPSPALPIPNGTHTPPSSTLAQFFEYDWVNNPLARPEILFLRRTGSDAPGPTGAPKSSETSSKGKSKEDAHIAFPGGRTEEGDEGGLYTAMRQTWEEIGLDLAERDFLCIGQLDDREITTSLGKRLLMVLSPYVFLQLTPNPVPVEPAEGTTIHWTPLESLVSAVLPTIIPRTPLTGRWSTVTVDAASRLTPRHAAILKLLVRILIGTMQFPAILIDVPDTDTPTQRLGTSSLAPEKGIPSDQVAGSHQLKLWGLSLGMTLDLLANMAPPTAGHSAPLQLPFRPVGGEGMRIDAVAPSLASVFPRFSYPDVNFWIWVFGKRYREVIRGWESSMREGGSNDKRLNWTGTTLNNFYAAVRKALLTVFVLRAIGLLIGLILIGRWVIV